MICRYIHQTSNPVRRTSRNPSPDSWKTREISPELIRLCLINRSMLLLGRNLLHGFSRYIPNSRFRFHWSSTIMRRWRTVARIGQPRVPAEKLVGMIIYNRLVAHSITGSSVLGLVILLPLNALMVQYWRRTLLWSLVSAGGVFENAMKQYPAAHFTFSGSFYGEVDDWRYFALVQVQRHYCFQPLTAYLSVNYFDRFLYSHHLPVRPPSPSNTLLIL